MELKEAIEIIEELKEVHVRITQKSEYTFESVERAKRRIEAIDTILDTLK